MNIWIEAIRPKTLIASLSPVLIGASLAYAAITSSSAPLANEMHRYLYSDNKLLAGNFYMGPGSVSFLFWVVFLACIIFAVSIQIGTNFANDYIDYIKGVDTKARKGPRRAVQSGLIDVKTMKKATFLIFAISALIGVFLLIIGGWVIGLLALLAIVTGYLYTGGPYPLSYLGLGDLCVLIFFGPVATAGVFYLLTHQISLHVIILGFGPGLMSTALLIMNNIRDYETDKLTMKKSLPVRFGIKFGKWEYSICLILATLVLCYAAFIINIGYFIYAFIIFLIYAAVILKNVRSSFNSSDFEKIFKKTGIMLTFYTITFSILALLHDYQSLPK